MRISRDAATYLGRRLVSRVHDPGLHNRDAHEEAVMHPVQAHGGAQRLVHPAQASVGRPGCPAENHVLCRMKLYACRHHWCGSDRLVAGRSSICPITHD